MTTISYRRTGGTLDQEIAANFDLNDMPSSHAQRLQNLINESNFFEIPVIDAAPSGPEEFEYIITVVSMNSIHTVRVTDTIMPKPLRPVIQELTKLATPADASSDIHSSAMT